MLCEKDAKACIGLAMRDYSIVMTKGMVLEKAVL
jgi:hypothetical protein